VVRRQPARRPENGQHSVGHLPGQTFAVTGHVIYNTVTDGRAMQKKVDMSAPRTVTIENVKSSIETGTLRGVVE
jgi:hypothetical protein